MAEKEVQIGDKIIGESTKVSLSIKTALWILGSVIFLFITAFTTAYIDVKSDVKEYKTQIDKDKSDFIKTVEAKLDEKLGAFQAKDEQFIKDIGDIKGDVKVILDRTGGTIGSNHNYNIANQSNTPPAH